MQHIDNRAHIKRVNYNGKKKIINLLVAMATVPVVPSNLEKG